MAIDRQRREFLTGVALAGAGLVLGSRRAAADGPAAQQSFKPADVNATEDLMREHGIIRRVLLVYGESIRRLEGRDHKIAEPLAAATALFRRFAEDYHERLEEDQLFPVMEKAGKEVELVKTLRVQHAAGRRLTSQIQTVATPAALEDAGKRAAAVQSLGALIRMYEPHAAREDTILFPAFHALFTEKQFDEIGDRFEDLEHKLLGGGSFESAVAEVAQIEKSMSVYELASFTPKP